MADYGSAWTLTGDAKMIRDAGYEGNESLTLGSGTEVLLRDASIEEIREWMNEFADREDTITG